MSTAIDHVAVETGLAQRLRAVAHLLSDGRLPPVGAPAAVDAGNLLDLLVQGLLPDPDPSRIWLLCTAISGAFPTAEEVMEGVRLLKLAPAIEATMRLLDMALDAPVPGAGAWPLRVVTDEVVVDVDHSARHDLHTGIQQVVRSTLPIWTRDHDVVTVAWTDLAQCFRALTAREEDRARRRNDGGRQEAPRPDAPTLLVPWRTVVVLPETPPREACARLAALAQFSGNAVVAVGHDCIPVVSADLVPLVEPGRFAQYLTVIKHTRRVAAVSSSAAAEFQGFAAALPAQGITGPVVIECVLAGQPLTSEPAPVGEPGTSGRIGPVVLSVGSREPRKNHLALLFAAERLWREGLAFELLLIGGSGWGTEISRRIEELQARGRPVELRSAVSDSELATAYREARFSVFASLHEGYGLPVAESLSSGTPVITSNYGSTREIGAAGGAMLVDPRDDEALVDAIRLLLTDDAELERLQAEIAHRPSRTWEQYAADLWEHLVVPVREARGTGRR